MKLEGFPAGVIDWSSAKAQTHSGQSGTVTDRTFQLGDQKIRLVTYSPGYMADHWCQRGHLTFVIAGAVEIDQADGSSHIVTTGASYHVADGEEYAHRLSSKTGATLFIVD